MNRKGNADLLFGVEKSDIDHKEDLMLEQAKLEENLKIGESVGEVKPFVCG